MFLVEAYIASAVICACTTFGLFVFLPGLFLSFRVTGVCPVTTDLTMRVNVRTTTTNSRSVHDMTSAPTETLLVTVECGRHSTPYSVQPHTEGFVCDMGDESGVGCTIAG